MTENIYDLLPPEQVTAPKPAMHKSMYPGVINPKNFDMGVPRREKGTFGPPNGTSFPAAATFLKKHSGEPVLPEPSKPSESKLKTKPPVPKKSERPVMGLVSAKNFVTSNAVENIL